MARYGALSLVLMLCALSLFSVLSSASLTKVIQIPSLLNRSPSSSGSPTSSTTQDSPQVYLDAHNAARKAVGEAPLVWNNTLASYAESYANIRKDCVMEHSNGPYGENLAMGSDLTAAQAVQLWVDEKKDYHHDTHPTISVDLKCLHYTQVTWSGTTSVGCAKVQCINGQGVFVICNYYPYGNVIGDKPY